MEGRAEYDREQALADYLGFLLRQYRAGLIDPDDYYGRLLLVLDAWDNHAVNLQALTAFKAS